MNLREFLSRFEDVSGQGGEYMARCPCHDDKKRSLSISLGAKGIVLNCFAGCRTDDILQKIGVDWKDLFDEEGRRHGVVRSKKSTPVKPEHALRVGGDFYNKKTKELERVTAVYTYRDQDGEARMLVGRTEKKSFPTQAYDDDGALCWGRCKWGGLLYELPAVLDARNGNRTILVVEGEKDVQSLEALGFVATCICGGGGDGKWTSAHGEWLRDADVVLIPDNDEPGRKLMATAAKGLSGVARRIRMLDLKAALKELPEKGDASDFIELTGDRKQAAERLQRLIEEAEEAAPPPPEEMEGESYYGVPGFVVKNGCLAMKIKDGSRTLCMFVPQPTETITRTDGVNPPREEMKIGAVTSSGRRLPDVTVPADRLAAMNWVTESWGYDGNFVPGQNIKAQVLFALSEAGKRMSKRRTVYEHMGWRELSGRPVYMYNGGAIGAQGISVELEPPLDRYELEDDGGSETIELAANQMLLLDVLPDRIGFPLMAAMHLAPLTSLFKSVGYVPSFVTYLLGKSGTRKSTLASLFMCHYGIFTRNDAPNNFHDTPNKVRQSAFQIKDAPLWIDDYHPVGSQQERARMETLAQNMLRAWGDSADRGRLGPDLRATKQTPPRGIGLMTGEDLPQVRESGFARMYLISVKAADVEGALGDGRFEALQAMGRSGKFKAAMRRYIEYVAAHFDTLPGELAQMFVEERRAAMEHLPGHHGRICETVAHLMAASRVMFAFWQEAGLLTPESASGMVSRARQAILENVRTQQQAILDEKPTAMFLSSIAEKLATRRICVQEVDEYAAGEAALGAVLAGYRDKDYYYFYPNLVYTEICQEMKDQGTLFPLSKRLLFQALHEEGLIVPDETANRNTRVKYFRAGKSGRFLWVKRYAIDGGTPPVIASQTAMDGFKPVDDDELPDTFKE